MTDNAITKTRRKVSRKIKALIVLLLFVFALSFIKTPEPLNPDTAPLPTTYEAYHRGEEQTYLTFPEWYIVYSSDEYARFIKDNPPSAFPYFGSIKQFWSGYWKVYQITKNKYPFNVGYHVMVAVIGTSITVEYTIKGIYENTIGRLTEWLQLHGQTEEEKLAAKTAREYVDFIRVYPWYEFDFAKKFSQLWQQTSVSGDDFIRKTERKFILSLEYGGKAAYSWVIKKLTYLSYEPESPFTVIQLENTPDTLLQKAPTFKFIKQINEHSQLIAVPRYDAFKESVLLLAKQRVALQEIAGNTGIILLTVIAPQNWEYVFPAGKIAFIQPILTQRERKRFAISVPVPSLPTVLIELIQQGVEIEHIYDY